MLVLCRASLPPPPLPLPDTSRPNPTTDLKQWSLPFFGCAKVMMVAPKTAVPSAIRMAIVGAVNKKVDTQVCLG